MKKLLLLSGFALFSSFAMANNGEVNGSLWESKVRIDTGCNDVKPDYVCVIDFYYKGAYHHTEVHQTSTELSCKLLAAQLKALMNYAS